MDEIKHTTERRCRDVSDDEDRFVCSECGAKMDWDTCEWGCVIGGFCFACGARIDN